MNDLIEKIHKNAVNKGFWEGENNVGEKLMLIVSELGEALEAHRMEKYCEIDEVTSNEQFVLSVKDTFEDELADAVIRILDLCGGLDIDLEWHVQEKMKYNESRERLHGKKY